MTPSAQESLHNGGIRTAGIALVLVPLPPAGLPVLAASLGALVGLRRRRETA